MSLPLLAAKLALGPVLLPQGRWARRRALRLPEAAGAREGTVGEGQAQLRVLVVGDSSAAGVGLADQAQALALPLAQRLNESLREPVGWQLVAQTGVNTEEARVLATSSHLERADVLVTVLGVNDVSSQTPAARFVEQLSQLYEDIRARTGVCWAVFCGLPPMHLLTALPHPLRWYLGRYSDWLDAALRDWTEKEHLGYCSLRWSSDRSYLAEDGYHPGPALYPPWAQRLAEIIVEGRQQRWARRA